jgi:hypothetical protein
MRASHSKGLQKAIAGCGPDSGNSLIHVLKRKRAMDRWRINGWDEPVNPLCK